MELSKFQIAILEQQGHLLVEGGPGSGKTTIAIIKAESIIHQLVNRQHILFLSFSNPAVSRIAEAIDQSKLFAKEKSKQLDYNNGIRSSISNPKYAARKEKNDGRGKGT